MLSELGRSKNFEVIREIVAQQLGMDKTKISPEANFSNDLGADSLDTVEFVMAIEERFNIEIPDEDAEKIVTLNQAVEFIDKIVNSK
uniref:Acyl carrier protein n=1 Tax=Leachiella pacifica TaxID=282357 RepID=A0A3S8UVS5_9FLOR|nr:acyl carrier protein [Leachiella pacifica]